MTISPGEIWRERRRNRYVRIMAVGNTAVTVRGCDEHGQVYPDKHRSFIKLDRFQRDFYKVGERAKTPMDGYWWATVRGRDEPCVLIIECGDAREPCCDTPIRREQYELMARVPPPPPDPRFGP